MKKSSSEETARRRSYGHHCAVARTLDVVGDRWTLLIMRELLLQGDARFTDLAGGLPGVASNLLADRLRGLVADGIIEAVGEPAANGYRLTARGRALAPVIRELTRWGLPLMVTDDHPGDAWRGRWAALALDSLLADVDTSNIPPFRAVITTDDDPGVIVALTPGLPVQVTVAPAGEAVDHVTVWVEGSVADLQRLLGGDPAGVQISGDPGPLLMLLATAGGLPSPAAG